MNNSSPNITERRRQPEQHADTAQNNAHAEHTSPHKEHAEETERQQHAAREQERDTAKTEALGAASTIEEVKHPHHESAPQPHGPLTKKQLDQEFNRTMKYIQDEMPSPQRSFSRLIHNKAIEKTSDLLGATLARPNALLAGSIGAFSLTLTIYIFAKTAGYTLSGFEPILAFLIGWLLGFLYDYIRVMATGKH